MHFSKRKNTDLKQLKRDLESMSSQQIFSVKEQTVSILGCISHTVSLANTQSAIELENSHRQQHMHKRG